MGQSTPASLKIPPLTATEASVALAPVGSAATTGSTGQPVPQQPDATPQPEAAPLVIEPPAAPATVAAPAAAPVQIPSFNAAELAAARAPVRPPVVAAAPAPLPTAVAAAPAPLPTAVAAQTVEAPPPAPVAFNDQVAQSLAAKLTPVSGPADADREAVAAFYQVRANQPIWTTDGVVTTTAQALLAKMAAAADEGLDPKAYAVGGLESLNGPAASPDTVADAEIAVSKALLAYVHDSAGGRVPTKLIGHDIIAANNAPEPLVALASIAISADPVRLLEDYQPTSDQYQALKRKLADLRSAAAATAEADPPVVPAGPTLKIGMSDPRVAVLRTRLGLTMTDGDVYDEAVSDAVRSFQTTRRIKPTGTLGPATLAALNSFKRPPRINLESEIIANMERWRWLPHDLGPNFVFVNVPQFRLRVTLDSQIVHEAKVIVGKPDTPTPIFSDTMEFVVFNPSWNVPESIIKKEYLPKLAEDPDYLARHGFVVTYVGDKMQVRQPPGEGNALGHIKFMFPNNFSVYLHDTSSRSLFAKDWRALSHGCVRVDQPYKFAEIVMGAENGWTEDHVRDMIGGAEQRVDLKRKLPVYIAYFTAYVDDDGSLKQLDDLYGYDHRVISALGLPLT